MSNIPEKFRDLFDDEIKAFAKLATTMADGSPQVTPVGFDTEKGYLVINYAKGRTKDRNKRSRPQVAMVIMDPTEPYRYIQIRGKVVGITEDGARDHINSLTKKYTGNDVFTVPEGDIRVIYKIEILKTSPRE